MTKAPGRDNTQVYKHYPMKVKNHSPQSLAALWHSMNNISTSYEFLAEWTIWIDLLCRPPLPNQKKSLQRSLSTFWPVFPLLSIWKAWKKTPVTSLSLSFFFFTLVCWSTTYVTEKQRKNTIISERFISKWTHPYNQHPL